MDTASNNPSRFEIVKAILEKAYDIHIKNNPKINDIKQVFDQSRGDIKFKLAENGVASHLIMDLSLELGVSKAEIQEAYAYIVNQATSSSQNDFSLAKAIVFNKKRLMRKTIRSMIYYCYGLAGQNSDNESSNYDHIPIKLGKAKLKSKKKSKQRSTRRPKLMSSTKYNSVRSLNRTSSSKKSLTSKRSMLAKVNQAYHSESAFSKQNSVFRKENQTPKINISHKKSSKMLNCLKLANQAQASITSHDVVNCMTPCYFENDMNKSTMSQKSRFTSRTQKSVNVS